LSFTLVTLFQGRFGRGLVALGALALDRFISRSKENVISKILKATTVRTKAVTRLTAREQKAIIKKMYEYQTKLRYYSTTTRTTTPTIH
jgi:hypothetical protein